MELARDGRAAMRTTRRQRATFAYVMEQRYDDLAQRLYDQGRDVEGDVAFHRASYHRCKFVLATSANGIRSDQFPILRANVNRSTFTGRE